MPPRTDRPGRRSRSKKTAGEFEFLARVRAEVERHGRGRGVVVGIGDDAAVVEAIPGRLARTRGPVAGSSRTVPPRLVLTTDTMVESVHFRASWLAPRELGVRAYRAAVSDVAAMGARPLHVLLSLELPGDADGFGADEALALVRGLAAEARRGGAALVGGNVSAGPRTAVTVTVIGYPVAAPVLRRDAKAGDLVFVTGALGGAAAGWKALAERDAAVARRRRPVRLPPSLTSAFRRPPLRVEFAAMLAERGLVHAMIDVSDGLLQDLGHVASGSRCAIRVDPAAVPVHRAATLELAMTGGEDYELAFTAPARHRDAIASVAAKLRTRVSEIGTVRKGRAEVTDADGRVFPFTSGGHDHLRAPTRGRR